MELYNSPYIYDKKMKKLLNNLKHAKVNIGNLLNGNFEEHLNNTETVLKKVKAA